MGRCDVTEHRQSFILKTLTIYDKDFEPKTTLSSPTSIIPISYRDSYRDSYCIPVTQNLFNNDEAYEYIVATTIDKWNGAVKGFSIVQEDGTVLYTMLFGENEVLAAPVDFDSNNAFNIEVLEFGGKYYLCLNITIYKNENDWYGTDMKRIYSFERGKISTSIKKVRDIPQIKVSPTLPQKNETIKVNLGDMKSAQKLYVVDTNGKVCFTQSIQPGQENVELSTSGMPAGMYIIRVSDGNKDVDNCRVIIR